MDVNELLDLKTRAKNDIRRRQAELRILAHSIHSHPETAMNEHQAVGFLTEQLKIEGFSIERGICDLPTAFRATFGEGKPVIAFIAEYDALPGIGHACGHNLIATAAVAAAIGTKGALATTGGSIQVIGTPAEEMQGGKIIMAERGAFNGVDAAMMMHPGVEDSAMITALACIPLEVEFFGKEAHAAAHPELGVNALEAMLLAFNAINSLRQHIDRFARIHGIITDGGKAANIVPAHSSARFLVRAGNVGYLNTLRDKVLDCFKAASLATGARLEYRWDEKEYYLPMRNNTTMARLYVENLAHMGMTVPLFDANQSFGSTDMGNLSQIVPAIHTSASIIPPGESEHTVEFARAAASERGLTQCMRAGTALAMTAIDLLASSEKMALAKQEFENR